MDSWRFVKSLGRRTANQIKEAMSLDPRIFLSHLSHHEAEPDIIIIHHFLTTCAQALFSEQPNLTTVGALSDEDIIECVGVSYPAFVGDLQSSC